MTKKLKYHIIASLLIFIFVTAAYNFVFMGVKGDVGTRFFYVMMLVALEMGVNGILSEIF